MLKKEQFVNLYLMWREISPSDVNFLMMNLTVMPAAPLPKIKDFRTFLEIYSFVIDCKQTD